MVFGDENYLKSLAKCWTHDLPKLVNLAGLDSEFGASRGANSRLEVFWGVVKDWTENSRYQCKGEMDAKELYLAITDDPDGVLLWIRPRW